jgi:hypothetical protein
MIRNAHFFSRQRPGPATWPPNRLATWALGLSALLLVGCGLDRSGLGPIGGDDAGFSNPPYDAGRETPPVGGDGGAGGGGGGRSGGGGADGGAGVGGRPGGGTGGHGAGGSGIGGSGTGGAGLGGRPGGVGGATGVGGKTGVGGMTGIGGATGFGGTTGVGGLMGVGGRGTGGGPGTGGGAGGACNPTTCPNGCCAGATCVTNLSPQMCGHAGAQCQACAACERCPASGACVVDPESQWDLAVVSAVLNPVDPADPPELGGVWDVPGEPAGGPLPDPFVLLDLPFPTVIGQVPPILDTVTPNWSTQLAPDPPLLNPAGQPLRAGDLLAGGVPWLILITDDDSGTTPPSGEIMCQIDGPLQAADFRAKGFTRTNVDSCFSATFKLTCHP